MIAAAATAASLTTLYTGNDECGGHTGTADAFVADSAYQVAV